MQASETLFVAVELDAARFEPFLSRNSLPVVVDFWAFERVAAERRTRA